ncbi:putative polyhydroxyalkanoic acid system protein [Dyella sp. OK004]|jgi:putative polyhydroxyalkanoate system protein|uniref:polyhydroxyalkanoic acid system family protein n=1 Tax=Dyella sp. OK004 TaxID=1855292 RepID=UPI0008E9C1F2|nr:polyhydroxyalkanoic acid system family protein [Dyella sp. OK004]SFS14782.1 putative polyhydroxyalkanoic acid system protein [Dyella sp. OK004]
MPKIDIRRPHQLSMAEARAVVDKVATRMQEKFGMSGQWQGDTLSFSRPGVSGSIAVEKEAIQVKAELGMMLAPLKGMVEDEIRRKLDEHFS